MPATGRSASTFARGGGRGDGVAGPAQCHPSQHAENQFKGFFRGLGVASKEPICSKRNSSAARLHGATHFAIGCKKWDDGAGPSTAHASFADPGIVYATCDAPDKNTSQVELRQRRFDPDLHFRTEQRDRFAHPGPQPRDLPFRADGNVHLGDDCPELITQTRMVHGRLSPDEALKSAGAGILVPNSAWPKAVRCNPIDAGYRHPDLHDLGMANNMQFGKSSHNASAVVMEANVRNPILGHHVPMEVHAAKADLCAPASHEVVAQANRSVPPLYSLGALRPHH